MKSENIFYWAFSNILNWSNLRAFFVGSLHGKTLRDVRDLYAITRAKYENSPYDVDDAPLAFTDSIVEEATEGRPISKELRLALCGAVYSFLMERYIIFRMPERPQFEALSVTELMEWRSFLVLKQRILQDGRLVELWRRKILSILSGVIAALPATSLDRTQPLFSIPLVDHLAEPDVVVERIIATFYDDDITQAGLFHLERVRLDNNLSRISSLSPEQAKRPNARLLSPTKSGFSTRQLLDYLAGTPFVELLSFPLPLHIPDEARFSHTHIIAGTGHGKTQTLQHLLVHELAQTSALVVIDSQGDMLRKLSSLSYFEEELKDQIIYIDPTDVEHPPALNMFAVNMQRYQTQAQREQALNGIVELYEYVFASLLKAELTQKQNVLFRFAIRLMLHTPGATIVDLAKFLTDPGPYLKNVASLPENARVFFDTEFNDKSFVQTKQQIRRRIWGLLENDTFRRMLSAKENRVDMFDALNSGKIVLVHTAKDYLKADASSILGRYFVALTLQAALERAAVPEAQRTPAFLVIDEAAEYFDDNVDALLNQARKYKVGLVLAHQYLDQLSPNLRSSIAANTAIKLAGGCSDKDARYLANDMRTEPEFITSQKRGSFACYIRNVTDRAVQISVPFGTLERQPQMSETSRQRLIDANRVRLSIPEQLVLASPPPAPEPDDWSG